MIDLGKLKIEDWEKILGALSYEVDEGVYSLISYTTAGGQYQEYSDDLKVRRYEVTYIEDVLVFGEEPYHSSEERKEVMLAHDLLIFLEESKKKSYISDIQYKEIS